MQKERKPEESFEDYKDRLRGEKKKLRLYCKKGMVTWSFDKPYVWRAKAQQNKYTGE